MLMYSVYPTPISFLIRVGNIVRLFARNKRVTREGGSAGYACNSHLGVVYEPSPTNPCPYMSGNQMCTRY